MKINISATIRKFFGGKPFIEVEGNTIEESLSSLMEKYPDVKDSLYDEDGNLRKSVLIYAGEENHTSPDTWSEIIKEIDLLFFPSIAGEFSPQSAPVVESVIPEKRVKKVTLDEAEFERYGKNLSFEEVGVKGQKRIKAAKVVIVGAGSLASPVIQYLAASGVGTMKVVDPGEVTLENLRSEVIHGIRDLKRPKVASAKDTVRNINKNILFEQESLQLEAENIESVLDGYDLVIDCSGDVKTRYLINDACVLLGIPWIFGAIYQYEGQVGVFNLNHGACYRCLFPTPPQKEPVPPGVEDGALGPLPGIVGAIQANEALKLIVGLGTSLDGQILAFDPFSLYSRILKVGKSEKCPICGSHPTITSMEDFDEEIFRSHDQTEEEIPIREITPEELARIIDNKEPVTIIDVREPHERSILRFPNAKGIPIGQLERRQKELNPELDTIFICQSGKRSAQAVRTLREAGYKGVMISLRGGIDAMKDIMFSHEGAWL